MDCDRVCEPERAGGVRDGGAGRDAGRVDGSGDGGERAGGVDVDGGWERVRSAVQCAVGGGDEPHDRGGDAGGDGGDAVRIRELVGQWRGVAHGDGARDGWSEALDPTDPVHEAPTDLVAIGKGDLKESESAVFPSLTKFTRVCAYSRPGTGLDGPEISTPVPQPQVLPYFW